jgi:hypothetical protein
MYIIIDFSSQEAGGGGGMWESTTDLAVNPAQGETRRMLPPCVLELVTRDLGGTI